MVGFPDESKMERSIDGTEPIRGGSIGLNRILSLFVDASTKDRKPRFNGVILSAFTIFNNVWAMNNDATISELEQGFVKDVNLFLDYYDTYLSFVWSQLSGDKFCPVVIYFPDYKHVPKEISREVTSKKQLQMLEAYKMFLARHGNHDTEVRKLIHSRCIWIRAGDVTYPHKEVARKFKEIIAHPKSLYTTGDPVCLMTHIALDYYAAFRIRGLVLLERHTARIRKPDEFRFKLDKEGNIPFQSTPHVVLGDNTLIKPWINHKTKKLILEAAEKDRWISRGEEDIRGRISKITDIPVSTLRKYDFI